MSFRPSDFLKESFKSSLKATIIFSFIATAELIYSGQFERATYMLQIAAVAGSILGIPDIPKWAQKFLDVWINYSSFKKYSPAVEEIDQFLKNIKTTKDEAVVDMLTKALIASGVENANNKDISKETSPYQDGKGIKETLN